MRLAQIVMLVVRFPQWIKEKKVNRLIFIRILLLLFNLLIFFGAVIWVILQFKEKIS